MPSVGCERDSHAKDVAVLTGHPLGAGGVRRVVAVVVELDLWEVLRSSVARPRQRSLGRFRIEAELVRLD